MERGRILFVVLTIAWRMADAPAAAPGQREDDDFFKSPAVFSATLDAPLQELFDRGRRNQEFTVTGTFSYKSDDGRVVTMSGVEVGIRGHSSLQETECQFPKLRLKLPSDRPSVFRDIDTLKVGTHCAERPD